MAWFLFAGDMLVMLFMVMLVIWVTASSSRPLMDFSASIPLADDPQDLARFTADDTERAEEQNNG